MATLMATLLVLALGLAFVCAVAAFLGTITAIFADEIVLDWILGVGDSDAADLAMLWFCRVFWGAVTIAMFLGWKP